MIAFALFLDASAGGIGPLGVISLPIVSADTEAKVQELCRAGQATAGVSLAVEAYGPEVYGFVVSRLRDESVAGDVFAQTCEDLCASIGGFEWRCSLRTWMYRLARSATSRYLRSPHNVAHRRTPLSQVSEIADRVRTRTRDYLRTEVKDQFAALCQELDPDDQMLLTLRIDRELEWNEVAQVLSDGELADDELAQASARLRQRFKTVKERLKERALEIGLLSTE